MLVVPARSTVALDNGRHLHEGETADVEKSERIARLIAAGHLIALPAPEPAKPERREDRPPSKEEQS